MQPQRPISVSLPLTSQEDKLKTLTLHVRWLAENRPFVDAITQDLKYGRRPDEDQTVIDYGKIYGSDSRKNKTLVLAQSLNAPEASGQRIINFVDNWFRGKSSGLVTIRIFEFLLAKTETFVKTSLHWIHCDTGNGNRGYELLYFLSTAWDRYQQRFELGTYCPRHAYGPADWHIGALVQVSRPVKKNSRITTLLEFSDLACELPNTASYVHGEDSGVPLHDQDLVAADISAHHPLPKLRKPTGIMRISRAQFRWKVPSSRTWFSQSGVCRVSTSIEGKDWKVWDLDSSRSALSVRPAQYVGANSHPSHPK